MAIIAKASIAKQYNCKFMICHTYVLASGPLRVHALCQVQFCISRVDTPGLSCITHVQDVWCMGLTCCAAVCRLMKPTCNLGLHMTLCASCNPWGTRTSGRPARVRRRWSSSKGLSSSPGQPLLPPDPPCSRCPHGLLITLCLACLLQSMAHLVTVSFVILPASTCRSSRVEAHTHEA